MYDFPELEPFYGQRIQEIIFNDNTLTLEMEGGIYIQLWDDGQSCCEDRYMTVEDDLPFFRMTKLINIDILPAEDLEDVGMDVKERQFLHIKTSHGTIVIANYNHHNGYYGGFNLKHKITKERPYGCKS